MKKASLELSLENVIGLIIGSILIFGLIFFVAGITDLLTNKPEQGSLNSFDALVITINQLKEAKDIKDEGKAVEGAETIVIKPSKTGELFADIPFYIQDNYGLIGFDRKKIEQTCGRFDPDLKKPAQCLKLPCLCLAKIKWGLFTYGSADNYERCKTLNGIRYIYTTKNFLPKFNLGEQHKFKDGNNNLAMWSNCGNQDSFKVKDIRVLKFIEGSNIDILFANVPETK